MYPSTQLAWRKSSYSGDGENCVEAAPLPKGVAVRDSKNPDGPRLAFTSGEWADFLARIRNGEVVA